MKKKKIGKYLPKNEVIVKNTESGDEYIKYVSLSTNLVFRSMLEDDLDRVSKKKKLNNKEKRRLLKKLQEPQSESEYFVIEELYCREIDGSKVIIAAVRLNNEENMTVDVFLSDQESKVVDQFAKKSILLRVATMLDEFYSKTRSSGKSTINRIA